MLIIILIYYLNHLWQIYQQIIVTSDNMNYKIFLYFLAIVLATQQWTLQAEQDRVTKLDGYIDFTSKFEMFSGYLTLQDSPLLKTHYLFVTSTRSTAKADDIVLWLNGGPGCSSLLGFTQQIGPNILYSGSKNFAEYFNPFSWNQEANLLFLESPPGVGFSVNEDTNYTFNDVTTAQTNVQALRAWFEKFPEFQTNNFWMAGESYCGMYIPFFASALIDANIQGSIGKNGKINFKGMMIGNGVMVTDSQWRRQARNKYYSKHYFYGPQITQLIDYCQYSSADITNPSCIRGEQLAQKSVNFVNPYATIGICYTPDSSELSQKHLSKTRKRYYYAPFFEQNNPKMTVAQALKSGNSPCTDDFGITNYFNQKTVKNQLHVDQGIQWESCSDRVFEKYQRNQSSIGLFKKFKENNLKILLFSGNTDVVVSYVETEKYVEMIGWKQTREKQAYLNDRDSLLYWTTEYDGLTLAIVNGAGHMVPSDKPNAAYTMFKNFINENK